MNRIALTKFVAPSLIALAVAFAGQPAQAAGKSACQGLDESACQAAKSCSWVSAFTNKQGKEVRAHCRSSGKGGEMKEKADDKKEGKKEKGSDMKDKGKKEKGSDMKEKGKKEKM